jgi:hypothetical protein
MLKADMLSNDLEYLIISYRDAPKITGMILD